MKDKHYQVPQTEVLQLITERAILAGSDEMEGFELTINKYSEEETIW